MIGGIMQMLYPEQMRKEEIKLQDNSDGKGPFVVRWPESLGPKPDKSKLNEMEVEHEAAYHAWCAAKKAKQARKREALELLSDEKVVASLLKTKNKRIVP